MDGVRPLLLHFNGIKCESVCSKFEYNKSVTVSVPRLGVGGSHRVNILRFIGIFLFKYLVPISLKFLLFFFVFQNLNLVFSFKDAYFKSSSIH